MARSFRYDSAGCFERHPKTRSLFLREPGWKDEKGRPTIVFPRGEGKELMKPDVWYEFKVEDSKGFYTLEVEGKPITHRVSYAFKCVEAPKPPDDE